MFDIDDVEHLWHWLWDINNINCYISRINYTSRTENSSKRIWKFSSLPSVWNFIEVSKTHGSNDDFTQSQKKRKKNFSLYLLGVVECRGGMKMKTVK